MKKLFFFKSSSRSGNNSVSPPSTEKKVHSEKQNQNPPGSGVNNQAVDKSETSFRSSRGFLSKSGKQQFDGECCGASSALRRSRSLSSTALFADGMGQKNFSRATDQSRSPSSSTTDIFPKQSSRSSGRYRALTPERHSWENRFEVSPIQSAPGTERPGSSGSSRSHNDSSGNSSLSSSNVSTKILDRYIDGEQHQERSGPTNSSSQRNYSGNVNGGCRLPPRVQYATPASPTDNVKGKSHSFRDAKDTSLYFSSRDWVENGFGHESPRRLAKNVVE